MARNGSIRQLYEMANTRKEPMWAVLDWAAQQPGDFTYKDLHRVYTAAGGGSNIQQFHSMIKVAKPDHKDPEKREVSVKRPFVYSKRGRQGGRGEEAARLQWGLDGPLRAPQTPTQPLRNMNVDSKLGDLLDELEKAMSRRLGGDVGGARQQLKAMFDRWKKMSDPHRIAADIQASLPGPYRMKALEAVWAMRGSKDTPQERDDAEDQITQAPQAQQKQTPFSAPKPKAQQPQQRKPAAPADDDDEELAAMGFKKLDEPETADDDDEDLGPGWRKVDEPEDNGQGSGSAFDDDEIDPNYFQDDDDDSGFDAGDGDGDGGGEETDVPHQPEDEYPAYLPDPDEEGDKFENAMYRLVHEVGLKPDDPLWNKLKNAKNDLDARQIISQTKIPQTMQRLAMLVAKAVFDNTGRDFDTGKKLEGLRRVFR